MSRILAVDPGTTESAFALLDLGTLKPLHFGKVANERVLMICKGTLGLGDEEPLNQMDAFAIEMVACYGMPVGKEVFETVFWIGRFWESLPFIVPRHRLYRKHDVCMNLCHDTRAKDPNIRQALIDRFGPVGTKREPGWFYGVSKDVWSAIAVGVTYADKLAKAVTAQE